MNRRSRFVLLMALLFVGLVPPGSPASPVLAQSPMPMSFCYNQVWRPANALLKDHALFRYDGYYYLIAIQIPLDPQQPEGQTFVYARTRDFCAWEDLGTVLGVGPAGSADEAQIWAPHVVSFGATWYMYYTGVNRNVAQTIMLATSTNPADPQSWSKRGTVFIPSHPEAAYPGPQSWSDARDPMIFYDWPSSQYVMYYTGVDKKNCPNGLPICGIVGAATAARITGPWEDRGAVLRLDSPGVPESAYVVAPGLGGSYYLFYNHAVAGGVGGGQKLVVGANPLGPWSAPTRFTPGWASDFFQSSDGWIMSYLGDYEVGVTRLIWDSRFTPARPQSAFEKRLHLPAVLRGAAP